MLLYEENKKRTHNFELKKVDIYTYNSVLGSELAQDIHWPWFLEHDKQVGLHNSR